MKATTQQVEKLETLGLVQLIGSDKQVAWARQLRADALMDYADSLMYYADLRKNLVDVVNTASHASDWINNRNNPGLIIVATAQKLKKQIVK